ncbi:unnamed protein product [Arctogadus glacialis]
MCKSKSYHLLELRSNGGLIIPSKGTVKVVRAAERAIRLHSPGKAPDEVLVAHFVREEIGTEDVFALGSHVQESQFERCLVADIHPHAPDIDPQNFRCRHPPTETSTSTPEIAKKM